MKTSELKDLRGPIIIQSYWNLMLKSVKDTKEHLLPGCC